MAQNGGLSKGVFFFLFHFGNRFFDRLDLGHSNIVYERMRTAVSHLSQDPLSLSQQPSLILQGTHLRPILLAAFSPSSASSTSSHALQASDDKEYLPHETLEHASRLTTEHRGVFRDDMRIQSWARRYAMMNPVRVEGDPILPLNPTQIRAIAMMIGETISLVQGVSRVKVSIPQFELTFATFAASRNWKNQNNN